MFRAAEGTHDDWPTYDRVMAEERRAIILIRPERSYGNHRALPRAVTPLGWVTFPESIEPGGQFSRFSPGWRTLALATIPL